MNSGYSEIPEEHKSFNILGLDNKHFAAQPNNRCLFFDKSLTPSKLKQQLEMMIIIFMILKNNDRSVGHLS